MTPPLRLHGAGAQALSSGTSLLRPETHKIFVLVIPAPIFFWIQFRLRNADVTKARNTKQILSSLTISVVQILDTDSHDAMQRR